MTLQRQVLIWAACFAVMVLVLWLLGPILLPFIAGFVLAYFLDPIADRLQKWGFSRLTAALLIVVLALLLVVAALVVFVPMLVDQVGRFAGELPALIQSLAARLNAWAPEWMKEAVNRSGTDIQASIMQFAGKASDWILSVLKTLLSGGLALVNLVSLLVVTPIVAFYMLVDWDRMIATIDSWVPRDYADTVRELGRDVNAAMAGFIRGQGTVCLLLGIFYAAGLTFAGLKFGLAIGLLAGALTFIPYAGAMTGGVLAIGVALVQFWPDYWAIGLVVGVFAVGQFLEGNFLSPKLVGKSIGLHPVWLMFALFAFGYAFGFVGLLLAVPMAAAAGVLVRFALRQYLASRLYLGADDTGDSPVPADLALPPEAIENRPA
ncbi:AI-2E family transporter [Aestuariivirga sp.]|uniref:AI-2E family transporter n=1 Tax=Aestuariivirga sp. TaxID=2650926 RepID=UPI0025BE181A|nr:AI-2E family transporter [Aestuariivirga sp.]MCA3556382.1 AI-2E family transporter [Aestuariivirga sp.]